MTTQTSARSVIADLEARREYLSENWSLPQEAAKFLYLIARIGKAKKLLEIGTSVGYSGLYLGLAAQENGGTLETVDTFEDRQKQAIEHFTKAGLDGVICPILGDAHEVMAKLAKEERQFDLIFIDADKAGYVDYLQQAEKLLPEGGVLIADNTQSHRESMMPFVEAILASPQWDCADVDTPNGFILARKRG